MRKVSRVGGLTVARPDDHWSDVEAVALRRGHPALVDHHELFDELQELGLVEFLDELQCRDDLFVQKGYVRAVPPSRQTVRISPCSSPGGTREAHRLGPRMPGTVCE